jgi:kynureninase
MSFEATLAWAQNRDRADPLREFRARFALPHDADGAEFTYLCGHSLGLMPLAARTLVNEELEAWASRGVLGHESGRRPWIGYHEHLTEGLAQLAGARSGEVVAMNSLTVNLHLMLASFFRPQGARRKILIEAGAFSSDRHAVTSQLAWHGLDPVASHPREAGGDASANLIELAPARGEETLTHEAIEECLARHGSEIALVLWPGVQFRTGQAFDLARIVRAARRAGCVVGFDLAHSIGNLPLELHASDADFAVWCGYKFLNGGPGAIGGCFVHERHGSSRARLSGWWGHEPATRFRMEPEFRPSPGVEGWQISNPPVLAAAPLLASLELFREAGIARLRAKSVELTGYLDFLLARLGTAVRRITPAEPEARGCQLSIRIVEADGRRVFDWLGEQGAICDWREPDVIRVAPVPFYNRFEDVFRFVELLAQAVRESR